MTEFCKKIYDAVSRIPKGRVASYGQIAAAAGSPRAARAVGNALHSNPFFGEVPCHRVVHKNGALAPAFAFGGIKAQENMLAAEGVEVADGIVDMSVYCFQGRL